MRVPLKTGHTADLVSVQAMISGDLGSFSLPGGELSWVLGSQWRYSDRRTKSNDAFDPAITPCPDSPPFGDGVPTCPVDVGAFIFNNPQGETQFDRDVLAFFAEVQVPIFDSLELGLAARFEDYGGTFGSNISPRASLRWQALSWLAFRGTAGSTFRAPPDSLSTPGTQRSQGLLTNPVTGVQAPRAIDLRTGVLDPEEANTYNVGFIVASDEIEVSGRNIGTFNLSVDYYIIDFTNEFQGESALAVYNAMFRGSNNPANWSCDVDALRERFNFRPADSADSTNNQSYAGRTFQSCHPSNLEGMTVERFNGDATDIKGLDIAASWRLTEVFGGELEIGVDASYMMQFKRSAVKLSGTSFVTEPAIDRADTAELLGAFFSYPEWRRTAYVKYAMGEHVVRWDTRYYSGTKDLNAGGTRRDSHMLHDITYRWRLPKYNLILTGTVGNLLDEEPPYIRSQFNYDYSTYSPLGRTFKLGVEYSLK